MRVLILGATGGTGRELVRQALDRGNRHGEAITARSAFPRLPRADVADFMLRQLTDDTYLRRVPRVLP